jgi:hypothetical protein
MQHPDKTHLQHPSEKIDETLGIDACNMRVQTIATCATSRFLKYTHELLTTYF